LPSKQGSTPEQTSVLEESLFKVSGQLSTITRNQKYFRTRENRNFSTVRSTEKRIVNFSLLQCALVVCMGALQVFVVRFFFQVRTLLHIVRFQNKLLTKHVRRALARVTYEGQGHTLLAFRIISGEAYRINSWEGGGFLIMCINRLVIFKVVLRFKRIHVHVGKRLCSIVVTIWEIDFMIQSKLSANVP
jgi:hypothetical protein